MFKFFLPDVDIRPSTPRISTLEASGDGARGTGGISGDGGMERNGNVGDDIFIGSGDNSGDNSGYDEVVVCIELANGNLQRNVSVNVMTISSPASTG